MVVDIHDSEFLLPAQFLTNEDIVSEVMSLKPEPKAWEIPVRFGSYGSSSSLSALSSPVDSELISTETESEEDEDYIAELTRQMAHYMLQDDDDDDDGDKQKVPTFVSEKTKVCKSLVFSSSPQQTPWSPLSSNHGSPKGHFQESSPLSPENGINRRGNIWGLATDHGENFDTTKVNDEWHKFDHCQKPSILASDFGFHSLSNQIHLNQEQSVKQQVNPTQKLEPSRGRACGGYVNDRISQSRGPIHLSQPIWPHIQNGSRMRALFLGGSNPRNGSCGGTGVFLPSGTVNLSESRKKQGCSRVLIPARVEQVLQLHFDRMGALSRSTAGDLPQQHGASMLSTNSNNGLFSQQKTSDDSPRMKPSSDGRL